MSEALLDPLEAHLDRAELRLARLASHEAVERLQRAYGYYVDKGLWSAPADLFADTPERLWARVLRRQPGELAWVSTAPLDPTMN